MIPAPPPPAHAPVIAFGLNGELARRVQEIWGDTPIIHMEQPSDAPLTPPPAAVVVGFHDAELTLSRLDAIRATAPFAPRALVGPGTDRQSLVELAEAASFHFISTDGDGPELEKALQKFFRPRNAARLDVESRGLTCRATLNGADVVLPAVDLSSTGLSVLLHPGSLVEGLVSGATLRDVRLVDRAGVVVLTRDAAVVRRCAVEFDVERRPRARLGISFESAGDSATRVRTLREPVQVLAALRKAVHRKGTVLLRRPDEGHDLHTVATAVTADTLIVDAGAAPGQLAPLEVVRLAFDLNGQSYSGLASIRSSEGRAISLALPTSIRVQHRRGARRHKPAQGLAWQARITHAGLGIDLSAPVVDVHIGGLSLALPDDAVLPVGLALDRVELALPDGGPPLLVRGTVRNVSRGEGLGSSRRCGLAFESVDADAHRRLGEALIATNFAPLDAGRPADFAKIWEFLPKAGLNYHLYADGSDESRRVVAATAETLLDAGRSIATTIVHRDGADVRGHINSIRFTSRTWLSSHLAATTGNYRGDAQISRNLVLAITEHVEGQPTAMFGKFYWKKSVRWPNRVLGWAYRSIAHPELAALREHSILVRKLDDRPIAPPALRIREATRAELTLVERSLFARWGPIRLLSHDLTAETLKLEQLSRDFAQCGLDRGRNIRLAFVGDKPVAVGLFDHATPGLQFNEFFNQCDALPLHDATPEEAAAGLDALALDAAEHYRRLGRAYAVCVTEATDLGPWTRAGFGPATAIRSLTIHRSIFPAFNDSVDMLFRDHGFDAAIDA